MVGEKSPTQSGEDRLIAKYFGPLAKHPGALGLADDAAVLTPPAGCDLVLTKDALVAGVHFFADDPPGAIARKALRVNLSDLAAKGATPAGFLLALALPDGVTEPWLKAFAGGLGDDADAYGCPLLGGDTVKTPGPLMVSITALGSVPHGSMVRRSGARAGDRVFVTGSIGDAALGLALRRDGDAARRWKLDAKLRDYLTDRYLLPQPRNALAEALRAHASAAMDVSDGLVGDFGKLCAASSVSAEIDVARVPLSGAARAALAAEPALIETVLTGGDDYEIICTMGERKAGELRAAAIAADVAVTEVGRIVPGEAAPRFIGADGRPLSFAHASFSHF
ncbi:MAG: thiamine-monophosphate kinase [Alphaproteobacteria bacterium]|jgi:thiamine-monophosphate kinase|nr:thiamine-monophosphate kinase [Alphaproteobacteria bacterium]